MTSTRNNFTGKAGDLMPREKMIRAADPKDVDDVALLAVLLKTGTNGCDVVELSRRLIEAFGSLKGLVDSDWRRIENRIAEYNKECPVRPIKGIGRVKCLELSAAFELGRRGSRLTHQELSQKTVRNAKDAYSLFREIVAAAECQETLYVLPLDAKHRPMCEPFKVSLGTVDYTPVVARDVFRKAISWGAQSVVVAHNHPSGDPTPSLEDIEVTKKLITASELVDVVLLDHIVLGAPNSACGCGYVSVVSGMRKGNV